MPTEQSIQDEKWDEILIHLIQLYLRPINFNPPGLKNQLLKSSWVEINNGFHEYFKKTLTKRGLTVSDYNKAADEVVKSDDDLYEFLLELYRFVYEEGTYSDLEKVMHHIGMFD